MRWSFDFCHNSSIFQSLKMICVEWSSSIVLISPQSSRKSCTKFTSSYLSIWSESVNSLTHQSHLARFSKVSSQVSFSCISVCERANFSSVYFSSKLFFSPVRDHFSQLTSSNFTVHISIINRRHSCNPLWESVFICTSKLSTIISSTIYCRCNESSKHQHSSWSCEHLFNVHSVCINKDKRFFRWLVIDECSTRWIICCLSCPTLQFNKLNKLIAGLLNSIKQDTLYSSIRFYVST